MKEKGAATIIEVVKKFRNNTLRPVSVREYTDTKNRGRLYFLLVQQAELTDDPNEQIITDSCALGARGMYIERAIEQLAAHLNPTTKQEWSDHVQETVYRNGIMLTKNTPCRFL